MIDIYQGIKEKGNIKTRIAVKEMGRKEMRKMSIKNGKIGKKKKGNSKKRWT
jgi:hypothetical protein